MNILGSVWLHPKKTVRFMIENHMLRLAIVLVLVSGFFGTYIPAADPTMYGGFAGEDMLGEEAFVAEPLSFVGLLVSGVFSSVFTLLIMFIVVGFIFLFGKLFKGKGTFWEVFQATAIATIPMTVTGIVGFVWAALNIQSFNAPDVSSPLFIMYGLLSGVLGIWSFIISIGALAEANRYSNVRAFFTLILPTILFVIVVISLLAFVVALFFAV